MSRHMRKKTLATELEIDGKLLPINTWNGSKPCYVEMLTSIKREFDAMQSWHEKVLMVKVDVHVRADDVGSTNAVITDYLDRMREWVGGKQYKAKRMGYVWVREVSTQGGLHYHVWLMINGKDAKNGYHFIEKSKQIVERHSHRGYRNVPYPPKSVKGIKKRYYYLVRRGNDSEYKRAFYHVSYFAKERTKDKHNLSSKGKNYSSSRITPNPNIKTIKRAVASDRQSIAKASSEQIKRIGDTFKQPLPTDKPVHLMTDAERQLPLF